MILVWSITLKLRSYTDCSLSDILTILRIKQNSVRRYSPRLICRVYWIVHVLDRLLLWFLLYQSHNRVLLSFCEYSKYLNCQGLFAENFWWLLQLKQSEFASWLLLLCSNSTMLR
jgi:hypothetical protein